MYKNTELIEVIKNLIDAEVIAERLLGTPLRRDQLNFIYKVIGQINAADPKLRENLIKKDAQIMEVTIPQLSVYKMIQHLRNWKDRKAEEERRIEMLNQKMKELNMLKTEEFNKNPLKQAGKSILGGTVSFI